KNITIVNLLNISEAEQLHMSTLIGVDEKKRRKNMRNKEYFSNPENVDRYNRGRRERYHEQLKKEGKLTREEKGILIRTEIAQLLETGLSQRGIAEELGVSQSTVNKHIKLMVIEEESLVS
ncbi:MAG TPA: response regulator transcription factor, partial [Epulopiscium sp.]|nr:response regulator transcription factor [Candidatus Epulonipiscium sp.]